MRALDAWRAAVLFGQVKPPCASNARRWAALAQQKGKTMARFNGSYSFRPGYHGVRKSSGAAININSDFWTCVNGHRNPSFELVDDRAKGGFVHREKVTTCKQCAAQQAGAADAPQAATNSDNTRAARRLRRCIGSLKG